MRTQNIFLIQILKATIPTGGKEGQTFEIRVKLKNWEECWLWLSQKPNTKQTQVNLGGRAPGSSPGAPLPAPSLRSLLCRSWPPAFRPPQLPHLHAFLPRPTRSWKQFPKFFPPAPIILIWGVVTRFSTLDVRILLYTSYTFKDNS